MKILVGSVFVDHPRSKTWYELQIRYLQRTTFNYTHIIYLNGINNFYGKSEVLTTDTTKYNYSQEGHIRGLNAIIDKFNYDEQYDYLLLLDSDCFPFLPGWVDSLLNVIGDFTVAAAMRCENLDTFAHPCVFFAKRHIVPEIKFAMRPQTNMVGFTFNENVSNVTNFYPLLRTNKYNHHPIMAGVYWNCFYHHGAGSRPTSFRIFDCRYVPQWLNSPDIEQRLFNELANNPDKFLQKLTAIPIMQKVL